MLKILLKSIKKITIFIKIFETKDILNDILN